MLLSRGRSPASLRALIPSLTPPELLQLPPRPRAASPLLGAQETKALAGLGDDDELHLEGFASRIFAGADAADRGGRSDAAIAKGFYAASIFFQARSRGGRRSAGGAQGSTNRTQRAARASG